MEGVPLIVRQEDLLEYNNIIWEFLCLKKIFFNGFIYLDVLGVFVQAFLVTSGGTL